MTTTPASATVSVGLSHDVLQAAERGYSSDRIGPAQVRALIRSLRSVGVEPADARRFLALADAQPAEPPRPAGRLLDLNAAGYLAMAADRATHRLTGLAVREQVADQQRALAAEMIASMRAEADTYLEAMAPAFAKAAAQVHAAVDLGLRPEDTAETVIRRGPDAIAAWSELKDRTTPVLDRIADARLRLTTTLGVPPTTYAGDDEPVDVTVAFAHPAPTQGRLLSVRRRGLPYPWQRWLTVAAGARLRLVPLAEVAEAMAAVPRRPSVIEDDDGHLLAVR